MKCIKQPTFPVWLLVWHRPMWVVIFFLLKHCLSDGKAELRLTGNLGNVMKESATTALSYLSANAKKYGIDPAMIEKKTIHIHVPEGAVPKDGPSAGITMLTAWHLLSPVKK